MRKNTDTKISNALHAWNTAPAHVRAMASGFVVPLIEALSAINDELAQNDELLESLMQNSNVFAQVIFEIKESEESNGNQS